MADGYDELTDKEKQTLRLMVRGHDAKSAASELALSVHTINERLRAARRKLEVTSSKEAARLLLQAEAQADRFPSNTCAPFLVADPPSFQLCNAGQVYH